MTSLPINWGGVVGATIVTIIIVFMIILLMFAHKSIYGAETTTISNSMTEYFQEIKFDTCHVMLVDIYNLTDYYNCIGL